VRQVLRPQVAADNKNSGELNLAMDASDFEI